MEKSVKNEFYEFNVVIDKHTYLSDFLYKYKVKRKHSGMNCKIEKEVMLKN